MGKSIRSASLTIANVKHFHLSSGVTLWLVPSRNVASKLKSLMHIRPNAQNEASYPEFEPHITLASLPNNSSIPLDKLRNAIPALQPRFQVDFESVNVGDHFFRSVYLAIKSSSELQLLHEHVHQALGVQPRTPAYPHVSLCYITEEDAAAGERDRYYHELEVQGRIRKEGETLSLNCNDREHPDWISGFEVSEVWIADCTGPVKEWKVLDKILFV
ncbi:hypothetical protein HGRIS_012962 [Hohenbuehelia grisea]|uniref:2',3'-cyclic-nucleotide 3'-phosphodiesterase n=1 Tax=Hohenbuehelia grisea TaxID=104357 RepID=A0ABR3ITX0_9AGAR